MSELDNLKKRADNIKSKLDRKIGVRQTHRDNLDAETKSLDANLFTKKLNQSSTDLLNLASFQRRENTVKHLERLVDAFVKSVYGVDYTFYFKSADRSFTKIEPIMRKPTSNGEFMEVDLKDGSGGGLLETCGVGSRFACNEIENYSGPLFLDETFKSISADKKINDLTYVLREYIIQADRQTFFISHKAEVFGVIADKIFMDELENNCSRVREATFEEIKHNYTFVVPENEVEN